LPGWKKKAFIDHQERWTAAIDHVNAGALNGAGTNQGANPHEIPQGDPAREIVTTRTLTAPRDLVFAVWTDTKHVSRWWGPNGFTTTTHSQDLRVGGTWIFVMHGPDGTDYDNVVRYDVITPPEYLAYTHGSSEDPQMFQAFVYFEDCGEKTKVTLRMVCRSVAECTHMREFGAVEGAQHTLARLQQFLDEDGAPAAQTGA